MVSGVFTTLRRRILRVPVAIAIGCIAMLITLSLSLSAFQNPPGSAPDRPEGPAGEVTVAAFSRDMTIFDSEAANGRNSADIPLRGTTTAADGAQIMAEIVDAATGGVVHPAAAIATASGGTWSGAYPAVPRNTAWLKPRVWVQGGADTKAETTNRFGVGLVIVQEDQSNTEQGVMPVQDELPQGLITIGNRPGDFQFTTTLPRGTGGVPGYPKTSASEMTPVYDGQSYDVATTSMRAMAKAFHDAMPGLKVAIGFIVRSGTTAMELLQPTDDVYDWNEVVQNGSDGVIDRLTADGSEIGIFHQAHGTGFTQTTGRDDNVNALVTVIFGTDNDGNVIVPDQTAEFSPIQLDRVDFNRSFARIFAHAMPGLLTGRTRWSSFYAGGALGAEKTKLDDLSYKYGHMLDTPYVVARTIPTKVRPNGIHQPHTGSGVDVHFSGDDLKGHPLNWASKAHSWLANTGLITAKEPRLDIFEWAPDGSYLLAWSSAGDITTQARIEGGVAASNFPENPTDAPGTPGPTEVLGITVMDPATNEHVNAIVEIVDENGQPAAAGRLRISDPAGGSYPFIYHHRSNSGGWVTTAGLYRDWMDPDNPAGHASRHLPVVPDPTFPWSPYGGTILMPPLDPQVMIKTIPTSTSVGIQVDTSTADTPFNIGGGFNQIDRATWEIQVNVQPSGFPMPIWAAGDLSDKTRMSGLTMWGSGNIALAVRDSSDSGTEATIYNTEDLVPADPGTQDTELKLLIEHDGPAGEVRVYRDFEDGAGYVLRTTTPMPTTFIKKRPDMQFLPKANFWGASQTSTQPFVSHFRMWEEPATQNGTPPAENVTRGVEVKNGALEVRTAPYPRP